jgi:DNA polymerase-3 subunit epsilon
MASERSDITSPGAVADSRVLRFADLADTGTIVALDFETANNDADSACALGVVRIEQGKVVAAEARLIQPPSSFFIHTPIHGIAWRDVADAPRFGEVWAEFTKLGFFEGAHGLAAHNAPFDRGVLSACARVTGTEFPTLRWADTVRIARDAWNIYPTRLPDVCRRLAIKLNHHDALSDAMACAEIVIRARTLALSRQQ